MSIIFFFDTDHVCTGHKAMFSQPGVYIYIWISFPPVVIPAYVLVIQKNACSFEYTTH